MTPHYADDSVTLYHGDCLDVLRELPDSSVDSVVTDPPYGLGFMGREWDDLPPGEPWARECLRVLKPGGHLLAFGGTRTWHRLACAVEDAGFEIRDSIAWLYGSGFPKSLDVSKAIDKAAGAEREVTGTRVADVGIQGGNFAGATKAGIIDLRDKPATPEAERWQGWGTALKPAFEPIVVGRKPLAGTVAANVLEHGTGALNIDGCRIATEDDLARAAGGWQPDGYVGGTAQRYDNSENVNEAGRWPANVVLDDTQAAELDRQSGALHTQNPETRKSRSTAKGATGFGTGESVEYADQPGTGASRFFPVFRYEAKAPTAERPRVDGIAHPTVKPLSLMQWLVRLVTPPGGTVLEPFAGSGTTAEACVIEGFKCIAIEREADYLPLILHRLTKPIQVGLDLGGAP